MKSQNISLTSGFNIRDLGGYQTTDGLTVRRHCLLRSGYLSNLTLVDQQRLFNYGVRTIIDLRTTKETEKYPDRFVKGIDYIKLPIWQADFGDSVVRELVFKSQIPNRRAGIDYMFHLYFQLLTSREAQQSYHQFLKLLTTVSNRGGILVHCSTGKDRTGIAILVFLHLLGVTPAVIQKDYMMTNELSTLRINSRMNEARKISVDPAYLKAIFDISTVRLIYYQFAVETVKYLYGNFDLYLRNQLNVDDRLIVELKHQFLM